MIEIFTMLLAILGISSVVIFHEVGHFMFAKLFSMPIKSFSIGFGASKSWLKGGIEYRLGSIPLGGYISFLSREEMTERGLPNTAKTFNEYILWKRIVVLAAGPLVNLLLGAVLLFSLLPNETTRLVPKIANVSPSSYAESQGITPGDTVLAVNGHDIKTRDDVITQIKLSYMDKDISFVILSAVTEESYSLTAPTSLWKGEGSKGLGITFISKNDTNGDPALIIHKKLTVFDRMVWTSEYAEMIFSTLIKTIIQLPTNSEARDQLGSLVMLGAEGTEAAKRSWPEYLLFLAGANFMIGLVNLLPFPFLDGSQILLGTIQSIIRRPIPAIFEKAYLYVGGVALASIFLIGILNDIGRYLF